MMTSKMYMSAKLQKISAHAPSKMNEYKAIEKIYQNAPKHKNI